MSTYSPAATTAGLLTSKEVSMNKGYSKAKPTPKPPLKKGYKKGDVGKKNVTGKTGFDTVAANATKEYGSQTAGQKVAGAIFQKMKKGGKL